MRALVCDVQYVQYTEEALRHRMITAWSLLEGEQLLASCQFSAAVSSFRVGREASAKHSDESLARRLNSLYSFAQGWCILEGNAHEAMHHFAHGIAKVPDHEGMLMDRLQSALMCAANKFVGSKSTISEGVPPPPMTAAYTVPQEGDSVRWNRTLCRKKYPEQVDAAISY
eukprot:SAG25_NODE_4964_length_723_cov_0.653846_1_plen_169_part_10